MPAPGHNSPNGPTPDEPWWIGQILPMPSSPPVAPSRPPLGGAGAQPPLGQVHVAPEWQPAPQPAPQPKGDKGGRRVLVAAGLAVVAMLLVSAATWGWSEVRRGLDRAGSATGVPLVPAERDSTGSVPASANRIVVRGGDPDSETRQLMQAALADVDGFWRAN